MGSDKMAAVDCRNCGAPMELFDRRRYYHCRHCGSFHFIETDALDGVRVLERRDAGRACPLCDTTLAHAQLDERLIVEHCERCRGVLVPRATFAEAVALRRARASGPGVAPAQLDRRELERRVTCPACRTQMDVHPYYGPGNIVIDTCSRCDLIWLDRGELKQVGDAPGNDRGVRATAAAARTISSEPRPRRSPRAVSLLDLLDDLIG